MTASAAHTRPRSSVLPQVQGLVHAADPDAFEAYDAPRVDPREHLDGVARPGRDLGGGNARVEWMAHSGNENAFPRAGEGVLEAQGLNDRGWIIVRLPAALDRAVVQSVLNAAREMIAEADAAEQVPQAAETEATVREWWASQRG